MQNMNIPGNTNAKSMATKEAKLKRKKKKSTFHGRAVAPNDCIGVNE